MYLHLGEKIDDQHTGDDKRKADDDRMVGLLVIGKHTDKRNEYDADGPPNTVGDANGRVRSA